MTLFTKDDCKLCDEIKNQFDLEAMDVTIEVLNNDAAALAHLAWHGLVETARKSLPILVLDDSSSVSQFDHITTHLSRRASQYGLRVAQQMKASACEGGSCALDN